MPNKRVEDLKDPIDREVGMVWVEDLGIPDLTTRELERAVELSQDLSDSEVRDHIIDQRKR